MNNKFTSSQSQTDSQGLDAISDRDIDLSDCPEITPKMFALSSSWARFAQPSD
ncbi:hypothetical protein [Microcoleus sp. D3_18a_C4]|uniref:hypothetical protein n=1 Tax=unclassified Microcoleus TaxID=2642155 RepID=UPI002FD45E0A